MSDYFKCEDIPKYRGSQHHADFGFWNKINENLVSGRR